MSFAEKIKKQEEEAKQAGYASSGSEWFKIKEGDNIVRVLAEPEMIFEKYKVGICYTDCGYEGAAKFMTYVAVREQGLDGTEEWVLRTAKLPYKIGTTIADLQNDEDYRFDEFPMPYNIKIKAKNAGSKEVEYSVISSPNRTPVPQPVLDELAKKKSISEVVNLLKEKKKAEHLADGTFQANQARKNEIQQEIDKRRGVAQANPQDSALPDYPEEEINPEDIPF